LTLQLRDTTRGDLDFVLSAVRGRPSGHAERLEIRRGELLFSIRPREKRKRISPRAAACSRATLFEKAPVGRNHRPSLSHSVHLY
jgi:hypothetical protein